MTKADAVPVDAAQARLARIAVSASFFMLGIGFALWAVHIPAIAARLVLDPAILGLGLLNVGLGAVISQPIMASIVARLGSRASLQVSMPVFFAAMIAPIIAWNIPACFAATFILGLGADPGNAHVLFQCR